MPRTGAPAMSTVGAERHRRREPHVDLRRRAQAVHERRAAGVGLLLLQELANLRAELRHVAADAGAIRLDEGIDLRLGDARRPWR